MAHQGRGADRAGRDPGRTRRHAHAAAAIICPVTVTIRVGAPIETAGMHLDDRDALIARVRTAIETARRPRSGVD